MKKQILTLCAAVVICSAGSAVACDTKTFPETCKSLEKSYAESDAWYRSHGHADIADREIADRRRHAEVVAEEAKCAAGKPRIGMTDHEAIQAWCAPYSVNTTITTATTREQWVYPDRGYLYFEGGRLVGIQRRMP